MLGNPLPDGSWALLHRDVAQTVAGLEEHTVGDGSGVRGSLRQLGERTVAGRGDDDAVPTPSRWGEGAWNLPPVGGLKYLRTLVEPAELMASKQFKGQAAMLLLAGNAGHADIPLTAPGTGLLGLLLAMLGQTVGFPVPAGGSGHLTAALAARFTARGRPVECGRRVTGIKSTAKIRRSTILPTEGVSPRASSSPT